MQLRKATNLKITLHLVLIVINVAAMICFNLLWDVPILLFCIVLFFNVLFCLGVCLPQVWLEFNGNKISIHEGIFKGKPLAEVAPKNIQKVRFKTYKEPTGKKQFRGMGNVEDQFLPAVHIGGSFTVLLFLTNRKNIEFGFYFPREKAEQIRGVIEDLIKQK